MRGSLIRKVLPASMKYYFAGIKNNVIEGHVCRIRYVQRSGIGYLPIDHALTAHNKIAFVGQITAIYRSVTK